jgi:hypothetical protein
MEKMTVQMSRVCDLSGSSPLYASKASPFIEELVLLPRNILRGKGCHISKMRAGNALALYRMDIIHGRLKCRSMAEAEVVDDASCGRLCRPSGLAPKWSRQGLGALVLVESDLAPKR